MTGFGLQTLILAQGSDELTVQNLRETSPSAWVWFLVIIAVFVLPFVLGSLIAWALRLKDMSFRIGLVLFVMVIGITPFAWHLARGGEWRDALQLGIDLAGGTNLVFEIDDKAAEAEGKEITPDLMDRLVGAVARRLDPAAQEQITVRQVGKNRLEVIIPGADPEDVERKKREMTRLGSLEFAILANRRDHGAIITKAEASTADEIRQGGRIIASWREVARTPNGQPKEVGTNGEVVSRTVERDGQDVQQYLVILDEPTRQVTGRYLTSARETRDQSGALAVGFNFNARGANLFATLTSENRPLQDGFQRRLAILLDRKIHSAPGVRGVIAESGIIEGQFSQAEIDELVNVLNAGALEVPINPNPISEYTISPTLGIDVQEKGMLAVALALATVFVFMLAYYWLPGFIACCSLLLNLLLLLGGMAVIDATFTLPGIAGIVLTIGMAVDTNVLIYERMREEVNRGSSLRMTIQNGFGRALSAIIDANVTTLITAVVLYMIGTDQVRGFAVTLFLGLIISMFTALYFGRLMFDILERKRWISTIKMMSVIPQTNFNFLKGLIPAVAISSIIIVAGLVAFAARGKGMLDIDFSGGTMVTFQFTEAVDTDEVRSALTEKFGTNITLERLTLADEGAGEAGRRFRMRTTETDVAKVRQDVNETLAAAGHDLRKVSMQFGGVSEIPAAAEGSEDEYAGGRRAELTFTDALKPSTVSDYLAAELAKIPGEGDAPKYDAPAGLFTVTGIAADDEDAAEAGSYTKMELRAMPALAAADLEAGLNQLQQTMATTPVFDEVNSFASAVAWEMQQSAILAIFASLAATIIYLGFRFHHFTFGVAAVIAVFHDVLVAVGVVALSAYIARTPLGPILGIEEFRINLTMIGAFLTIVGYSLNDTIVIFDRVREIRGKNPALTPSMINLALNQTLSRTILTSLLTFLTVLVLYIFGGEGIKGFAFSLVVGIIAGVYSTVYMACPMLLWLTKRFGESAAPSAVATSRRPAPTA